MRQILIQHARAVKARKRGGDLQRVTLDGAAILEPQRTLDVVELGEALDKLEALRACQCSVVELRVPGGLDVAETAFALGVSGRTVKGDWHMARTWLARELAARGEA